MSFVEDIEHFGRLIDAFHERYPACHVTVDHPGNTQPPLDMRAEQLSSPGWVACKVLTSTLKLADVESLESEFQIAFPPAFRAHLFARFHLIDQLHLRQHRNQLVSWPHLPSVKPLEPLREILRAWCPLLKAGYIPFGGWDGGAGPMCFDTASRDAEGECPVVWLDHELLFHIGPDGCTVRERVFPLARSLYNTSRELLLDVFSIDPADDLPR